MSSGAAVSALDVSVGEIMYKIFVLLLKRQALVRVYASEMIKKLVAPESEDAETSKHQSPLTFYLYGNMTDVILPSNIVYYIVQHHVCICFWPDFDMASQKDLSHCNGPYVQLMYVHHFLHLQQTLFELCCINLPCCALH